MHDTLKMLDTTLAALMAQVKTVVPNEEPIGVAHGAWNVAGLTRSELIAEAQGLADLIKQRPTEEIDNQSNALLKDYVRRLEHLRAHTVPQFWSGNAGQAIPAYLQTLNGLRKALEGGLRKPTQADAEVILRKLTTSLRGLESKINGIEPRTTSIESMLERIEHAYNAADQLPTDLESLAEARKQIKDLLNEAIKDQGRLTDVKKRAEGIDGQLKNSVTEAKKVLEQCETAYSAATSVGLAAAFSERSNDLSVSMRIWVAGLISALVAGSYFGSRQLSMLSDLFKQPEVSASVVLLNLMLSLLSIGAPVWFGWLATKQIGQRFRLAEDYAFKASVSRAYEGFRREAARVDKAMEARLLSSALTRLDELPLRLVETETHGSPWHELASSDLVKEAVRSVPGFASQVKELAEKAVDTLKPSKEKNTPASSSSA